MSRAISYIEVIDECYCQPDFSVTVLAERFHVSQSHMSKLLLRGQGMSFTDYLWKKRLEKAKELLLNSDMTVEAVAEAVGYSNVSSFRRKFKADVGVTPLQFRELERTT